MTLFHIQEINVAGKQGVLEEDYGHLQPLKEKLSEKPCCPA